LKFFADMKAAKISPNSSTVNIMIEGLCKADRAEEALKFFQENVETQVQISPNLNTFKALIGKLSEKGNANTALPVLHKMKNFNIAPTEDIFVALIDGFYANNEGNSISDILKEVHKYNITLPLTTLTKIESSIKKTKIGTN